MDELDRLGILRRIAAARDDRVRGKILQRLLAIAFDTIGYRLVDERLVEGTDLDVCHRERTAERYSFEVSTTQGFLVPVENEDLRLMDERVRDGYLTGIAGLRIAPGGKWVLVRREWLTPPSLRLAVGNSPGWEDLAMRLNRAFDEVTGRLGEAAVEGGLEGLAREIDNAKK